MKKKLAIVLVLALAFSLLVPLTAQAAGNPIKRIGLSYKTKSSDTTVASASLNNKTGWGYSLGYYNDQRQFVSLGWIQESKVSVLITQNLYLTSSGGYSYTAGNQGAVGCFHVQLPGQYADFSSAKAAADAVDGGFVAWVKGTYYVRVGSYTGRAAAQAAAEATDGATMGETSGYGYSVVPAGSTKILFQFDADEAGETGALGVLPLAPEGDRAVTLYNGDKSYYGGFRFERISGGQSTVVNMIELEDYVKCVVPYEMSTSWPLEALKAQAVCARTYAGGTRHSDNHFDLCPTTCCQAYKGAAGVGASTDQAVDETAGQMLYYDGKRIDALYYSSNGGASEDNKNVNGYEYPYLKGKVDPYEEYAVQFMTKSQLSYYRWTKTWTAADLKKKLNADGYDCSEVSELRTTLSPTGNVISLTVVDNVKGKTWTFGKGKVRTYFNLNSIRFAITQSGGTQSGGYAIAGAANAPGLTGLYAIAGDGSVSALPQISYIITESGIKALEPVVVDAASAGGEKVFTFNGTGWGHNVGMSQWGAYAMAKQGYTYQDILKFYYTDITIQ